MHIHALSSAQPIWVTSVIDSYQHDEQPCALLQRLLLATETDASYTLHQGVIRKNGKIWLPTNCVLQHQIIVELHATPVGGHFGVPVTLRRLKQLFYWQGMNKVVHDFVSACTTCQQAKPDRSK
jgi:hypothetical protein